MHLLEAIVLGIVQGLTEFLPISSSAHLLIVPKLLGWADSGSAFTAVTQLGTVTAVLLYFRQDIIHTLRGMLRPQSPEQRLGLSVLVGTLPILVLGFVFKKFITGAGRNIDLVAALLIIMGLALLAAENIGKKLRPLGEIQLKDGVLVGFAQALALIPGASRSGSTLVGAFLTGLERAAAVRFSFLLSIPATAIAGIYELKDVIKPEPLQPGDPVPIAWSKADIALATVIAGVVGYACIAFLLKYLARHSTVAFVVYRVALGVFLLLWHGLGHL